MSKSRKLLLGVLSLLPLIMLAVYMAGFIFFFMTVYRNANQEEMLPLLLFRNMAWLFLVMILMVMCSLGLLIYFIIHTVNNTLIDSTERIIWILVFIFAGTIGFPIYWYMRIWKVPLPA
jgi:Phospholipase_D-nuclease N-terminal